MIGWLIIIFAIIIFFLPSIIASGKRNGCAIFAFNILLGWTFVGWVIALVWALCKDEVPVRIVNYKDDNE